MRLVEPDPDIYQDPKPEGQEYKYCVFEQLPNVSTVQNVLHKASPEVHEINSSPAVDMEFHIAQEKLHQLQQQGHFFKRMCK